MNASSERAHMTATEHLSREFLADCDLIAQELRGELCIRDVDPMPVLALAQHLATPVVPLSNLLVDADEPLAQAVRLLREAEAASWSAVTVHAPAGRLIVVNDGHRPGRQANSIAHELSHGLLMHAALPALDERGCRRWDQAHEREADWLASVLLVPRRVAERIARNGWSDAEAARIFGVSTPLMRWRMNMTAARKYCKRTTSNQY
jgi:hypothetical protein